MWRLKSSSNALAMFTVGFHDIIEPEYIRDFSPVELQSMMAGSPFIAVEDWAMSYFKSIAINDHGERKTVLANPSEADIFWEYINSLSEEERRMVFEFITASAPPARGAKTKITIVFGDFDTNLLPSSQTCFNSLFLPRYTSFEMLKIRFDKALELSVGFGFD
jgi:ubiquitin-protein ligase E3 A